MIVDMGSFKKQANKYFKYGYLAKNPKKPDDPQKGMRCITAQIIIGPSDTQISIDELKRIIATRAPIAKKNETGDRIDARIDITNDDRGWTINELQQILQDLGGKPDISQSVKPIEEPVSRGPGRPKKENE